MADGNVRYQTARHIDSDTLLLLLLSDEPVGKKTAYKVLGLGEAGTRKPGEPRDELAMACVGRVGQQPQDSFDYARVLTRGRPIAADGLI